MKNPEFLSQKFGLEKSEEVEKAVDRKKRQEEKQAAEEGRELEKTSKHPSDRVQMYLDRLERIFNPPELEGEKHKDFDRKERNLSMMKRALHKSLVVDPETATEEYIKHQQTMARQQGHGDVEVPDRVKEEISEAVKAVADGADIQQELQDFPDEQKQMAEEIVAKIHEQKHTLDSWVDYLASPDATYPDWLKYWTMRSVTQLASYDKDEKRFPSRDETTTNPFPALNREALAYVLEATEKNEAYKQKVKAAKQEVEKARKRHNKKRQKAIAKRIEEIKQKDPDAEIDREQIAQEAGIAPFDESAYEVELPERPETPEETWESLDARDFAKLYAWAMEKVTPTAENVLTNTNGEWVKYDQGGDYMALAQSLQGHGTGWCTAGEPTAESQLARGDFYVYYSEDEEGELTIPRAAIRMEGDSIAEVRGIAEEQHLDPYISEVVGEKMKDFGEEGEAYQKKADDMRRLTGIERKMNKDEALSKEELRFLYEIDGIIEGFGYEKNPRIQEIRDSRDFMKDMEIIFESDNHKEIADKLIDTGKGMVVAYNLEKFEGLDKEIAGKLIDAGEGEVVARKLKKFEGLDHKEIADKLIDAGEGEVVAYNLEKFEGLDHKEIADKLIDAGRGWTVAAHLEKFEGLDHKEIAGKLIDAEKGEAVAYNLKKFEGLDHKEIADKLIDAGIGWGVASNLKKFEGLDHKEIADKLDDAGEGLAVADYLEKFEGLDEELADRLIDAGEGWAVARNLEKLGLDEEVYGRLRKEGFIE